MTLATSPRRSPMKASATIAAITLDEMTHSQDPQSLKCPAHRTLLACRRRAPTAPDHPSE